MADYRVTWSVDVEADTPVDAAREAEQCMRESLARVYLVRGPGVRRQIDLEKIDDAADLARHDARDGADG